MEPVQMAGQDSVLTTTTSLQAGVYILSVPT